MRKIFVFMIAVLVVVFFAGCSNGDNSSDTSSTSNASNGSNVSNESNKSTGSNDSSESKENEGNKQVTIKYFTFSPSGGHEKDLDAMIKAFEKKNPNIHVKPEIVAFDNYFTKLQTQIAGGNAPDTFELNYENFVSYASKGTLLNLSPIIKKQNFNADNLNQKAYKAFNYNGNQYGMVESFSNVVLFYNKDLFDKNNVEYPQADWTWDDELKAAQKLTDKDKGIWGTFSPIQFTEFYKTIAQNGGSVFNQDKSKATLNSKKNIEALQWMHDKIYKYHVTPSPEEMSGQKNGDLFKAGKIAMLRTGIWMFDSFKDASFKWDIALEPGNTQKAHHFFANALTVSKNTEHPEAAWKWLKFMSASKEAAKVRIDSSWELPAVQNEELVQKYLDKTPPESRDVVFKALNTLVVPPVVKQYSKITDKVGKELEKVKYDKTTPKKALDAAEKKVKNLLGK